MSTTDYSNLSFIHEDPTFSGSTNKSVIRSHVSRWSWRNVRYLPANLGEAVYAPDDENSEGQDTQRINDPYESRTVTARNSGSKLLARGRAHTPLPQYDQAPEMASGLKQSEPDDLPSSYDSNLHALSASDSSSLDRYDTFRGNGFLDPFQTHVDVPLQQSALNDCSAYCGHDLAL
ncbi:hypothetical protein N7486_005968 [Penicillium sp. IBT 16267x]|nr:hypothetical protein N7486_005968 [Penicillium sp. IBT 16267x]